MNEYSLCCMPRKKLPDLEEAYKIVFKSRLKRSPSYSKQFSTILQGNQLTGFFPFLVYLLVCLPQFSRDFISALGIPGHKWIINDFPEEGSNVLGEKDEWEFFRQLPHSLLTRQLIC